MREIKFRVWWVHPESECSGFDYFKLNESYVESDPCQVFDSPEQYTGLKDKNGVEIYEGDIIKINLGLGSYSENEICYDANWCRYVFKDLATKPRIDHIKHYETIGNIHGEQK